MATKGHKTGMLGVYLTAAELTKLGLTVSVTSRSALGADILATDEWCKRSWSIQVKTNSKPASFWLTSKNVTQVSSKSHVYVFVNLRGENRPDFYVVPSDYVAKNVQGDHTERFFPFYKEDRFKDAWKKAGLGSDL